MSEVPTTQKELKALVDRRHPDYTLKAEHWEFLNTTYESPREWFRDNIFQFVREGDATYTGRLERAYRFNHTREVVDLVNKYLFKHAPLRSEDVPEEVKRFRMSATLSGLTLEQFEKQVARKASIVGRCYVVVDNNAKAQQIVTKADEKKGRVRLYAYVVMPKQFLDCGYDENGQFSWVLLHELARDDDDPFTSTGENIERFRLWTKEKWYLFQKQGGGGSRKNIELVDHGSHDLGVVPVLKCDHIESDNKYSVPALIEDIAYLDRAVANYLSNLDQIINDQTFSQLAMPAQGLLPGVAPNGSEDLNNENDPDTIRMRRQVMKLGTSQILLYDGEHGGKPEYISPDPKQAELIITSIKQIINEIYHTVGLAGERTKQDNSMGIDNSSGVAKAFDFERVNALLSAKAAAMQGFSNRIEQLVQIYHGADPESFSDDKPTVIYSTNFDVRGLNDELAIASQFSLLQVPMEIRQHQLRAIVEKMWPMLAEVDKNKLKKAIETWQDSLYTSASSGQSAVTDNPDDPMGKKTTQGFKGEKPKAAQ